MSENRDPKTGYSVTGYPETTAPGHFSEWQSVSGQECVRAQEKAKGMLRRGGVACEVIDRGSEMCGIEFGQMDKGRLHH